VALKPPSVPSPRRGEGPPRPPVVLVVYYADHSPLRTAIADHLYAIARYGACSPIYLNVAIRSVPTWIRRLDVDMVVFHTTMLAQRWHPPTFRRLQRKLERLRRLPCVKVALPQDEFIHTDQLCDFLRAFRVDQVLTCAAEGDWPTIYGDLTNGAVTFTRVLTGYLDPLTVSRIARLGETTGPRTVDVAYRAWRPEHWLGRHAQLKGEIADVFAREAPKLGLTTDISVRENDTLIGDAWFRLLLAARWTIGVEGGASILDRDGTLRERTLAYVADHPGASFEEVEAACFPGLDGSLGLMAISPRHLEACATRTAQVLVEGEYNGILRPGTHYLPLKRDFSNLSDTLSAMADDNVRSRLADHAFRDIVESRRFEYGSLADLIVGMARPHTGRRAGTMRDVILAWERRLDRPSWHWVAVRQRVRPIARTALARAGLLPAVKRVRSGAGTEGR
jgi:hypothetical protein